MVNGELETIDYSLLTIHLLLVLTHIKLVLKDNYCTKQVNKKPGFVLGWQFCTRVLQQDAYYFKRVKTMGSFGKFWLQGLYRFIEWVYEG